MKKPENDEPLVPDGEGEEETELKEEDEIRRKEEKRRKSRLRTRGPYRKAHANWTE